MDEEMRFINMRFRDKVSPKFTYVISVGHFDDDQRNAAIRKHQKAESLATLIGYWDSKKKTEVL